MPLFQFFDDQLPEFLHPQVNEAVPQIFTERPDMKANNGLLWLGSF